MHAAHNSWNPDAPRILCISPYFAPMRDSEAFCSTKFVNALTDRGAQITTIVCANEAERGLDRSEMWNSVRATVVRIPPAPARRSPFASLSSAVRYRSWLWARWTDEAVREAKKLHQDSLFDVVYSRSQPMFGQITGYWCAKELNLPWIANLNDPFYYPHQPRPGIPIESQNRRDIRLSDFWMKRTLRYADLVTCPSGRLCQYLRTLSSIPYQSYIIPHIGNSRVFQTGRVDANGANFHLVHAGKLGSHEITGRSAAGLLEGLRLFLNECEVARNLTKVTLVGPEDPGTQAHVRQLGLEGTVASVGPTDYEESLKYIRSSTACLLVEGDMAEGIFLPSKLVDYITAQKPILALSPRIGVVADLVSGGGIIRVDPGDACAIRDAIRGLYEDFRKGTLPLRSPSDAQVDQFRPELVANRFLGALRELIAVKKESKLQRAGR
jgi:Glycosyl transferase 4-like domain